MQIVHIVRIVHSVDCGVPCSGLIVALTLECFTPHSRLFTRYAEEDEEEKEEEEEKGEDEDKVEDTEKDKNDDRMKPPCD